MRRVAALAVLAIVAACTSGPASDEAAGPAGAAALRPLVPASSLAALLPEVEGWTRARVESAQVGLPAPAAHASTSYSRDAARVDMEITDTAGQAEYIESTEKIAGTSFDRASENGYIRGAAVAGAPAVESWNHVDRLGEITVLVDRRFVVHASGSGLEGLEALRAFVEAVPFDRLAALAPR